MPSSSGHENAKKPSDGQQRSTSQQDRQAVMGTGPAGSQLPPPRMTPNPAPSGFARPDATAAESRWFPFQVGTTRASSPTVSQTTQRPGPQSMPSTPGLQQNTAASQATGQSSGIATDDSTRPVQTRAQPRHQPAAASVPAQQRSGQAQQAQTPQRTSAASQPAASTSSQPVQTQAQENPASVVPAPQQAPAAPATQSGNYKVQLYTKLLAAETIAVVGDFGLKRPIHKLAQWIEANGGIYAPEITPKVTKMICAWQAWKMKGPMVIKALETPDLSIVSYDWLEDSIIERRRLGTHGYRMQDVEVRRAAEWAARRQHINKMVEKEAIKYRQSLRIHEVMDPRAPTGWQVYRDDNGLQYEVTLHRPNLVLNWTETWQLCMYITMPHGDRIPEATVHAIYWGLPQDETFQTFDFFTKTTKVAEASDMIGLVKDRFKWAFLQLTGVEWDLRAWGQRRPVCVEHTPTQYKRPEDGRLVKSWKYKFQVMDDEDYRSKIFPWYYTFDEVEVRGDDRYAQYRGLLYDPKEGYWYKDNDGKLHSYRPEGLVWPLKKPPPPPPEEDEFFWGGGPGTLSAEAAAREKKNEKSRAKKAKDEELFWAAVEKERLERDGDGELDGPADAQEPKEANATGKRKRAADGDDEGDEEPPQKRGRGRPRKDADNGNTPTSGNPTDPSPEKGPDPAHPEPRTENMFFTYTLPDVDSGEFIGTLDRHWGIAAFGNWHIAGSGAAAPPKVKMSEGKRYVGGDVASVD